MERARNSVLAANAPVEPLVASRLASSQDFGTHKPMPDKVNTLVVDDDPGKLLTYEVVLSELGENLIKAQSAKEALEVLLRADVALVLLDVSMPDLNGFELAQMIRELRFHDGAILISGVHLTDSDKVKAYQRGATDYISVPIIPELLRAKVRVFVDLHRKSRQLEVLNQELRRVSGSILASQDEERRRIARELHDRLGQELSAAKMAADQIPHCPIERKDSAAVEVSNLIDQALQQVRSISHLLHPPLLDEAGLCSALKLYLNGIYQPHWH